MVRSFCMLAVASAVALCAAPAGAASAPKPPSFAGVWTPDQGVLFSDPTKGVNSARHPGYDESINPAPLTPEYAAKYQAVKDAAAKGVVLNDPGAKCLPPGMPRLMLNPWPWEVLETPGRITLIFTSDSFVRRIFTDGRKHPADLDPTFNGHSVGHWEGDTLVVDTVGMRADTMLQGTGMPHSGDLHVTERIRLLNPDKLEDAITIVDPKALTRPYVSTRTYSRLKTDIEEYVCLDGLVAAKPPAPTPTAAK